MAILHKISRLNITYGNRYLLIHGIGLVILNEPSVENNIMENDQWKLMILAFMSILIFMDLNEQVIKLYELLDEQE